MIEHRRLPAPVFALMGLLALAAVWSTARGDSEARTAASKGMLYAVYEGSRAVNIDDRVLRLADDARIVDRRGGMDVEIGHDRLMQVPKPVAVQYRFRYTNRRIEVVELALTRGRGR
ncbi:MAG TPA: hypothetical protein ENK53_04205 [Thiotrichales bacterium]|nr:hypothetical protein [Thiotrichales bacterium]